MKYFYGTVATLGIFIGLLKLIMPSVSSSLDGVLWLIFGAVCPVAAEISEVGSRASHKMNQTTEEQ
jgi:hypothetical protein